MKRLIMLGFVVMCLSGCAVLAGAAVGGGVACWATDCVSKLGAK
jgi:hypothetical protein